MYFQKYFAGMLEILNFALDISNIFSGVIMKRSYIVFAVSGIVLLSALFWFLSANSSINFGENIQFLVILLLVIFGLFFGIRRFKSEKRGEPTEDELSKMIMQKASSLSYFISLYLWLVLMYISGEGYAETEVLFGWGILGMGVIFAVTWFIIYFFGTNRE
jgi:hypothetical protein